MRVEKVYEESEAEMKADLQCGSGWPLVQTCGQLSVLCHPHLSFYSEL